MQILFYACFTGVESARILSYAGQVKQMQFADILGQNTAIHIIKQAIRNRHVAHAYLFSGPEGVGKRSVATAMAQFLNCSNPNLQDLDSCGHCPSCIQAKAGSQPDILYLAPDDMGSIKIEPVRNLISRLSLQSYESVYKIAIIDDAHTMTTEAANALLKTLEEPADNTVFILVSSQFQNLPETILSRCQQVVFQPLAMPVLKELLVRLHPEHRSRIGIVAALSQGSLSMAIDLLADEEFSALRQEFYEILLNLSDKSISDLILWCDKWKKNRKSVHDLLELGQIWYHDLLALSITGQTDPLVNQDYLAELSRMSPDSGVLLQVLDIFQTGVTQLTEHNATPELVLNVVLLKTRQVLSA